ncbi:MAG: hypothetical protein QOK06_1004, partial [Acidimicrobiaceae bacterium]
WELTTDWTYIRFHGPQALDVKYWGRYGRKRLARPAAAVRSWLAEGHVVYAYFNNDHEGHAIGDALDLKALVET